MQILMEFEFKDRVDKSKPDIIGIVEIKLSEIVKCYAVFPEECTTARKRRQRRGRTSLLVRGTINFQEVMLNSGLFSQFIVGKIAIDKSCLISLLCMALQEDQENRSIFL